MKRINLVGKKFGRLAVIERAKKDRWGGSRWRCLCDCGKETVVAGNSLQSGGTRSCGCLMTENAKIDETGNRYGRLVVTEEVGQDARTNFLWRCICDCGKEKITSGRSLRGGHTKSCGCLHTLPAGQADFNSLYRRYITKARKRGLFFELTKEDFSFLTKMNCFYCGIEPAQVRSSRTSNGEYIYNGIDRIDSSKGYTMDNVVACCKVCNVMKNAMTVSKFKCHLQEIVKRRGWY